MNDKKQPCRKCYNCKFASKSAFKERGITHHYCMTPGNEAGVNEGWLSQGATIRPFYYSCWQHQFKEPKNTEE